MKKIKKADIAIFIILFSFTSIVFSGYLTKHFATDTFNIINIGYKDYAIKYSLTDGRIFMGLIGFLANATKIPIIPYTIILEIFAIIVSVVNVLILKNIILQYKKLDSRTENILLIIICYYTIFNYTFIENMYFVECFVMSLSILFYIVAASKIIKENKYEYIKATILLFFGLISYQGTISAFFMFVLLFSMLKNKNIKTTIKKFIIAIGGFFIAFMLNSISIAIIENFFDTNQTRTLDNITGIIVNILVIIANALRLVIYNSNLFPKYLYIIFISVISLIVCIKIVKQNNKNYNRYNETILMEQLIIIFSSVLFAFAPSLISLSAFESARIRFSMGAMIGFLFIHLAVKTDFLKRKIIFDKILIAILIIYCIINSVNYIYLIHLNKWVNKIDKQTVYEIDTYIDSYEKENNLEVNNISIVIIPGNISKAYYPEMNSTGVGIAISSVRTEWAAQGIINYYTNRKLEEKKLTEEEKEEYIEKVNEEKNYLCIGDTLYISVFWYN